TTARVRVGGQDHPLHDGQAVLLHEHVLGPAEPDALGAEAARPDGVVRIVAVRPYPETAHGVRPLQQLVQLAADLRLDHGHGAGDDVAGRPVDGELVAFEDGLAAGGERASFQVDLHRLGTGDAGLAHTAGDHGGVRGTPAP